MDLTKIFRATISLMGCVLGIHGLVASSFGAEAEVPSPVVSPEGGLFATNVLVSIAPGITNGPQSIRYTLDGSEPGTNSSLYTVPLLLTNNCLLQARAFATNGATSPLLFENYLLLETNLIEFTSTLPLLIIGTYGRAIDSSTNLPAVLRVIAPGTNGLASIRSDAEHMGPVGIKTRGYSSLRYPKKSFALETRDTDQSDRNVSLLGLPKDSDWVLYAPYPDKTLIRDVLAYELSNKMGHYASRTRFVEVFVNDTTNRLGRDHYVGLYVLEEKVKRGEHRVDIAKLSPHDNTEPAITGGYIFKKDHLDEVERKAAATVTPVATTTSTNKSRSLGGRPGYPTGPGGFPADPAAFPPAFVEPPETNFVTLTNVTLFTNIAFFTNAAAVSTVAVTTNILEMRTFAWTTNIVSLTNVTYLTNVLASTNIAALTNVVTLTNRMVIANVPPFTGEAVFTNLVSFTNSAAFTNIAYANKISALTNVSYNTNVFTIADIVARTNTVPATNLAVFPQIVAVTNVVAVTNLTVAEVVLNPIPPSPIPPKLPPLLTRLVETGEGFVTSHTNSFYYVEPKAERITSEQRAWLSNHVNQFEAALYGPDFRNPTNGYNAFIDAGSFIDHHLMVEATKNIDGYRFSTFFQKDRGGKIRMQPIWDWNLSLGNARGRDGYLHEQWYWPQLDDRQYSWFRQLFEDPDFAQRYVDRWAELRATVFVASNLLTRVDQMAVALREPAARNFQRWPILGQQVSTESFVGKTWAEDIDYLKGWISNRLSWVNAQFLPAPTLAVTAAALADGTPLNFTTNSGRIFFTIDGTDPRQSGGGVSPAAKPHEQPVALTGNVNLFARTQLGNRWSSPLRVKFVVRPPSPPSVSGGGS